MQGKTINGFTIRHMLGTGGMAEVWYAENKIGKKAAVKMLLPKLCQDENVVSRFLNEAKVMVDLNHPNIRQVYDYGDIDGRPAIIMEYLEGDDLKARMKRGQRFTDEELKRWWNQLVDALNYTHKKGIVHRDIKPGNIFVNKEGNIKLLDFGIAKVRESISSTKTGQKLGTLMYMSPEQVKDSKHIDYKTDVYSLAVTFVHLITGKKPYDSDTSSDFEISEQIVYKPLDMTDVPTAWKEFLSPYLEKGPAKRPPLSYFKTGTGNVGPDDDETKWEGKNSRPTSKPVSLRPKKKYGPWIGLGVGVAALVMLVVVLFKPKIPKSGKPVKESVTASASFNGHEYVDLGLPSGTLWATCNVGAAKPEGYGNYYAWGETKPQAGNAYSWSSYKYANGSYDRLTKYCNKSEYGNNGFTDNLTTLQSGDDPAVANWGSGWRTPSKSQWDELIANTTNQWTTRNGVSGRLFTSKKNGQTLFLPAAGRRGGGELDSAGSCGNYWSRSLNTDYPGLARHLYFLSDRCNVSTNGRIGGFSVRPVREK